MHCAPPIGEEAQRCRSIVAFALYHNRWQVPDTCAAGLPVAAVSQTNVSFRAPYDPRGPSTALPLTDATNYILGNFASVAEVRRFVSAGG